MEPIARPLVRAVLPAALLLASGGLLAQNADRRPEIQRPAATPQANGQVHSIRTIPEVCTRFEGRFTGDAADPYQVRAVRSDANCQARARLVEPAQARPERSAGWTWYDSIRIPSAACPAQVAVLDVWRKAGTNTTPKRDAQGRVRIYIDEAMANADAARAALPQFSVRIGVEGEACR